MKGTTDLEKAVFKLSEGEKKDLDPIFQEELMTKEQFLTILTEKRKLIDVKESKADKFIMNNIK